MYNGERVIAVTHDAPTAWPNGITAMGANLKIFVEPRCESCEHARTLAVEMATRFPALYVEIVDLSRPGAERPDCVFAVPTFVLNGRVFSLGNPRRSRLVAAVEAALNGRRNSDG
jgi:hypothetical protein